MVPCVAPLNLESAALFLDVVRLGSLSAAATENLVSKSMVKRHIDSLEAFAGTPLLVRGARGTEMTAAGEVFAARVEAILRSVESLRQECSTVSARNQARTIRIASTQISFSPWCSTAAITMRWHIPMILSNPSLPRLRTRTMACGTACLTLRSAQGLLPASPLAWAAQLCMQHEWGPMCPPEARLLKKRHFRELIWPTMRLPSIRCGVPPRSCASGATEVRDGCLLN